MSKRQQKLDEIQKQVDELQDKVEYMKDYQARAREHSLSDVEDKIWSESYEYPWASEAVKAYEHIRREINYEKTGPLPRNPVEQYELGKGDCQDQTLMLATIWNSLEYVGRSVSVSRESAGHVLFEIGHIEHTDSLSYALDEIAAAYQYEYGQDIGEIYYEQDSDNSDKYWIVADPVQGDYIGDASELIDKGYIDESFGSWQWSDLKQYQEIW